MEHHPNVKDFWKPSQKIVELWKNEIREEYLGENGDDPIICLRCGEKTHTIRQCMRYKTILCKYHLNGYCSLSGRGGTNHCMFAHGQKEIRYPRRKKCVRVTIDSEIKKVTILGCGQLGHTYNQCCLNSETIDKAFPDKDHETDRAWKQTKQWHRAASSSHTCTNSSILENPSD